MACVINFVEDTCELNTTDFTPLLSLASLFFFTAIEL